MDLTPADTRELAAFFARRIDVRLEPAPPARTPAEERQRELAWELVLDDAQEQGTLSALLHRVARRYPDDANLQEAIRLLSEPGRAGEKAAGLVFLAAGAAGILAMVGLGMGLTATAAYNWQNPQQVAAAIAPRIGTVGEHAGLVPVRTESAPPTGRCTAEDGGRVGYWYAGSRRPGSVGDVVSFDQAVNVRIDYPDKHNAYDARTRIECVLQPGDRVRISEPPVFVPGGRFWVPITTGDLQVPPRTASNERPGRAG